MWMAMVSMLCSAIGFMLVVDSLVELRRSRARWRRFERLAEQLMLQQAAKPRPEPVRMAETPWTMPPARRGEPPVLSPRPYLRPAMDSVRKKPPPPPPRPYRPGPVGVHYRDCRCDECIAKGASYGDAMAMGRGRPLGVWLGELWAAFAVWLIELHPDIRRVKRLEREEAEADRLMEEAERARAQLPGPTMEEIALAELIGGLDLPERFPVGACVFCGWDGHLRHGHCSNCQDKVSVEERSVLRMPEMTGPVPRSPLREIR